LNKKENFNFYSLNVLNKQFKFFKKNNFLEFLLIQKFFFKKYFNLYSSYFYNNYSCYNNIKLIFFYLYIYKNTKNKINIFNLNVFSDWYKYNFNLNFVTKNYNKKYNYNLLYLKNLFFKYNKLFLKNFNQNYKNIYFLKLFSKDIKIKINNGWSTFLKKHYLIKFTDSSISKYINIDLVKSYKVNFIRKNRIFNKGRYSRNRQLYRTGVY
jgi:hypothetical protein